LTYCGWHTLFRRREKLNKTTVLVHFHLEHCPHWSTKKSVSERIGKFFMAEKAGFAGESSEGESGRVTLCTWRLGFLLGFTFP
jgi:hypothetical protein